MKAYAYLTGVEKRDGPLRTFADSFGAKCLHADTSWMGGLSILWGFADPINAKLVQCMRTAAPVFHCDHAYFKRGYGHGNYRVNFGNFHQTRLLDVPDDRSGLAKKRLEPWNKAGRDVVLIVPSDSICNVIGRMDKSSSPKTWVRETEAFLKTHTDRPIRIKHKGSGLLDELRNAFAVVSLSSVAEVEAAVHGVPVFVTPWSPAQQVGETDFSRIETPRYPDREQWLRTLSYSQFNVSEFKDGTAAAILRDLYL